MDRKAIKEEAKAKIKGNLWTIWKAILVMALITGVINGILGAIFPAPENAYEIYMQTGQMPVNKTAELVSSILNIALLPMSIALVGYILKFTRGEKLPEGFKELVKYFFSYYKNFLPIFLVVILVGIFTGIGFAVLIIPGIIIGLMLSMCQYLLADGRTDTWQIIKDSAAMMKGHKWELFVFGLSFIGWFLLVGITFGIAAIYVVPYVSTAECIWYEKLKALNK